MPIKGSLSDMSISDILQMLSLGNKTGELVITNEKNLVYFYIKSGHLRGVQWMNRKDKLGMILLDQGHINEETLNEVLALQKDEPGVPLGKMLLDFELVDEETIIKYLKKQIRDTIIELSEWDSGYFVFKSGEETKNKGIPVSIKVEDVLLESAALQDEFKASALPDKESILVKMNISDDGLDLDENEKEVLKKVDGRNTLSTILTTLPLDEFRILQILSKFLKEGIIKETEMDKASMERAKLKTSEHKNLGIAFLRIEMYKEAIREFSQILKIEPDNTEALFYKGIIHYETGEVKEAKDIFNSVLKQAQSAAVLNNLSVIMDGEGDLNTAFVYIKDAKNKEENNTTILLNEAILLIKQDKTEEAIETLKDLEETSPYARFYYAYILTKLGKINEAISHLEVGLNMNPQFGEYYYNLGKLFETLKEEKKAVEVYRKGLKVVNNSIILTKALIAYYYKNKIFDQCEKRIDAAISSGVEDWDLYFKKGNILFQKKLTKEAIDAWEKALKLNPDNKTIKRNIERAKGNKSD